VVEAHLGVVDVQRIGVRQQRLRPERRHGPGQDDEMKVQRRLVDQLLRECVHLAACDVKIVEHQDDFAVACPEILRRRAHELVA